MKVAMFSDRNIDVLQAEVNAFLSKHLDNNIEKVFFHSVQEDNHNTIFNAMVVYTEFELE